MRKQVVASLIALPLIISGGCSTIVSGTGQNISVNTNPAGATCEFERQGAKIAEIGTTPGVASVSRTKHNILIKCNKDGYQQATYINRSGWESGSGGAGIALDVLLTLGASSAIDSATGADNKYEPVVNLNLIPEPASLQNQEPDS